MTAINVLVHGVIRSYWESQRKQNHKKIQATTIKNSSSI